MLCKLCLIFLSTFCIKKTRDFSSGLVGLIGVINLYSSGGVILGKTQVSHFKLDDAEQVFWVLGY